MVHWTGDATQRKVKGRELDGPHSRHRVSLTDLTAEPSLESTLPCNGTLGSVAGNEIRETPFEI